jgi:3-deoxy-D-manno-octulosonate 8-phosphate phosphatase (KDO 8-P phosphatase)
LGVKDIFLSSHDKWVIFEKYVKENNLNPEEILYMGDDIVDYRVLKAVGVSTCPQDAAEEIRDICDYTSPHAGGKGCVRDVIEQTLKVQGLWMDAEAQTIYTTFKASKPANYGGNHVFYAGFYSR